MTLHPAAKKHLAKKLLLLLVLAAVVGVAVWWRSHSPPAKDSISKQTSSQIKITDSQTSAGFNKNLHSPNDPSSLWVVVNKGRSLPANYRPTDLIVPSLALNYSASANDSHLRTETAKALEKLVAGAQKSGYKLKLFSGYRSYDEQVSVYNNFVKILGQTQADISSARPGHSEHQTGLAADVSTVGGSCELEQCYGDTPAGQWLAANSYQYGFIIRYSKGSESLTGYEYEPWHLRYVGMDLAVEIKKNGQTLEHFFGLPAYTDYPAQSYLLNPS